MDSKLSNRVALVTGASGGIGGEVVRAFVREGASAGPARFLFATDSGTTRGWNPAVHLFSQARGTLRYDDTLGAFVPGEPLEAVRVVGARIMLKARS